MNSNGFQKSHNLIMDKVFDGLQNSTRSELLFPNKVHSLKDQNVNTSDPMAIVYGFDASSTLEGQWKHGDLATQKAYLMHDNGPSIRRRTFSPLSDLFTCVQTPSYFASL